MHNISPFLSLASSKAVVVMGGSFDPVHFGHLTIASQVLEYLNVTKICLMPCYQSPFKVGIDPNTAHRKNMLELAIKGDQRFYIDAREIDKPKVSYTVETLEEMRAELGSEVSIILLMGQDAWYSFSRWHRWHDILTLANVAVCYRYVDSRKLQDELQQAFVRDRSVDPSVLSEYACGKVAFLSTPRMDISSTLVREKVKQNKSIRYFVPDAVIDYVDRHQLYH